MKYNIKLEQELISKLGFKKNWLSDKSGYWLSKKFKFNNIQYKIYVQSDSNLCTLEVQKGILEGYKFTKFNCTDPIAKIPCTFKSIKETLKKYK